jgi:hypothetical protein
MSVNSPNRVMELGIQNRNSPQEDSLFVSKLKNSSNIPLFETIYLKVSKYFQN